MPLVDNGRILNSTDIQELRNMIMGSLESHVRFFEVDYPKYSKGRSSQEAGIFMGQFFRDKLEKMDSIIDNAQNAGSRRVNVNDFISKVYGDFSRKNRGRRYFYCS